jgi:hypothetical protein
MPKRSITLIGRRASAAVQLPLMSTIGKIESPRI